MTYKGRITKALAGFYYVTRFDDGVTYACKAKGIFRKRGSSPLVGDVAGFVVTHEGDKEGSIEELDPRSSVLHRPTVANVDLALVTFAVKNPDPNLHLLDRMLVVLEAAGLDVVICFNKTDLMDNDYVNDLSLIYEASGYKVICTCVPDEDGKSALSAELSGHLTTVVGPSGAGKSSIINMLRGSSAMEVGEVSSKIGRGKQTTRHVELISLSPRGSYIVDTPGFSSLDFNGLQKEDLGLYFPEIKKRLGGCKYPSCSHIHEPVDSCVIRRAVLAGEIDEGRYESYTGFYEELDQKNKNRK